MNIDFTQVISADAKAETNRAAARARLADLRWRHETGGVVLDGVGPVATDRETQARLTSLVQALEAGLIAAPVSWKAAKGWVDLSPDALRAMARAVATHVQAGFAAERKVLEKMEAADPGVAAVEQAFQAALRAQL